ncbi:MAG TPA: hypothetical protein DIV79_01120, partial [Opitutae bacterium]|nr:hypothetical protein [Opitutae bacterium]
MGGLAVPSQPKRINFLRMLEDKQPYLINLFDLGRMICSVNRIRSPIELQGPAPSFEDLVAADLR